MSGMSWWPVSHATSFSDDCSVCEFESFVGSSIASSESMTGRFFLSLICRMRKEEKKAIGVTVESWMGEK